LPSIFNGLRISWGYGWRTIVAAELVFGSTAQGQGLGHFINTSRIYLATDEAMAGILMVIILGLLFETLFRILQRETTMRWGMER
jgi:NitT/TauT family transport system permease protein